MAFGNQIGELKAKTTSRIVRETGSDCIRAEINNEGTVSGKINGMLMHTISVTQYADGTGKALVKVAVMGAEGEMASGEAYCLGLNGPGGKVNVRGILALHSTHPKWNWLNTTPIALESSADMQTGEETGRLYEWK